MEEKNYNAEAQKPQDDEVEIDLMDYVRRLWVARKPLLISLGVGLVLGVVIALSVPKKYTVTVTLSPEMTTQNNNRNLSSVASMFGINGVGMGTEEDALNVMLFPNIVSSVPFILELFETPVRTDGGGFEGSFFDYLDTEKRSWMGAILALPGMAVDGIKSLFSGKEEEGEGGINGFRLSKDQWKKVNGLRKTIEADVDKNTGVTTVSVTLQDPVVSATIADVVLAKLQEYIISYRVSKAQQDCDYLEQLFHERQQEYYDAQQEYAAYVDANRGVIFQSALTERERLQNDMNLAYQVYTQVATQLQVARAKVQEAKPVFAVVEPASVPLKPSGMSKKVMVLVFIILAFLCECVWVLWGKSLWDRLKVALKTADSENGSSDGASKKERKARRKRQKSDDTI